MRIKIMFPKKFKHFVILYLILFGCISPDNIANAPVITPTLGLPTTTSTLLPTATNTVTPSQTSTPPPTLTVKQANQLLKDLLWNNPECTLPCFMGITPGKTTFEEIDSLFMPVDPFYFCELNSDKTGRCSTGYKFDTGLAFDIRMHIKAGIVENLKIPVTLPKSQSLKEQNEWSPLMPNALVKQYGVPSRINIFADLGPTPIYAIDLYFDSYDMIYSYHSYDFGINLRICPTINRFDGLILWVGKNPMNPPLETVPLEEATTMTREEFSNLLTSDIDGACFTLNKAAFP
jgi:hypothetical protein